MNKKGDKNKQNNSSDVALTELPLGIIVMGDDKEATEKIFDVVLNTINECRIDGHSVRYRYYVDPLGEGLDDWMRLTRATYSKYEAIIVLLRSSRIWKPRPVRQVNELLKKAGVRRVVGVCVKKNFEVESKETQIYWDSLFDRRRKRVEQRLDQFIVVEL